MFSQKIIKLALFLTITGTGISSFCGGNSRQIEMQRALRRLDDEVAELIRQPATNREAPAYRAPANPRPAAIKPASDYQDVEAECAICRDEFTDGDYVAMCNCACRTAYHLQCIQRHIDGTRNAGCPTCRAPIERGTVLPSRLFEELESEGAMVRKEPEVIENIVTIDPKTGEKKVVNINGNKKAQSVNNFTQLLAALILGCSAEHVWSSKELSNTGKVLGFSGIAASFLSLQDMISTGNTRNRKSLKVSRDFKGNTLSWIAGTSLGFLLSYLCKKFESKIAN